jgi:hypothetical protein
MVQGIKIKKIYIKIKKKTITYIFLHVATYAGYLQIRIMKKKGRQYI